MAEKLNYWQLWVNPATGQLEAAIELCSFRPDNTFGPYKLYIIQGKRFITDYSNWNYWCEHQDY